MPEATEALPLPTTAELLSQFGGDYLSIQSLFQFCFIPSGRLALLKELSPEEHWGDNNFALLKYLSVHLRLELEQGRYVWNGEQIVLCAGRLGTASGAPVYVGLVRNQNPGENPWVLNWVGERPSCAELPEPAELGTWPAIEPGAEPVIACDLASEERRLPLPRALSGVPATTQLCAIAGALTWSLHRGLWVRQIHGGGRGYFVPLWLETREDLSLAPDLVAPVLVQERRLVVRTLLEPQVAYAPARVLVERWEQLPPWLLDAWDTATEEEDEAAPRSG